MAGNEDTAKETEKKPAPKKTATSADTTKKLLDQLVYVGPSIPKRGIRHGVIYKGGKPAVFRDIFENYPVFETLFVPVSDLVKAQKQVVTEGTALYLAAQEMKGVEL